MMNIMVNIMVETISLLGIATKEIKQCRISELTLRSSSLPISTHVYSENYLTKLIGNTDVDDALQRLDDLTKEEALMASAELLRRTHSINEGVHCVREGMEDVRNQVQGVHGRVESVDEGVQDVRDTVQGVEFGLRRINHKVDGVDDKVEGVRNRVDQVNRQHLNAVVLAS